MKNPQLLKGIVSIYWVAVLLFTIYILLRKTEIVGGPDFLFYILGARDHALHNSPAAYGYFPGVQWFWTGVIQLFGANISAIQTAYITVLIGIMTLIMLNSQILFNSYLLSLFGGTLAASLLLVLEGTEGVLEPFGVFMFLLGLTCYQVFLKQKNHLIAFFSLCAATSLSVFMKQQGLVYLVAGASLPFSSQIKRWYSLSIWNFIFAPLGLFLIFVLFLLDGGGLEGLLTGLSLVKTYQPHGSFIENLANLYRAIDAFTWALLTTSVISLYLTSNDKSKKNAASIRLNLFLIATIAGFLVQFKTRGYLHYGIYLIPGLVLLTSFQLKHIYTSLTIRWSSPAIIKHLLPAFSIPISIVVFLNWPYLKEKAYRHEAPRIYQEMQNLSSVCNYLNTNKVLLIPARGNAFHWICNTVSADKKMGYSWAEENFRHYDDQLKDSSINEVFVFNPNFGEFEKEILSRPEWQNLSKSLKENDFKAAYGNESGTLYHRRPN